MMGTFHYDRERVEGVGRQAQRVVDTYDKSRAQKIADGQTAVAAWQRWSWCDGVPSSPSGTAAADVTSILSPSAGCIGLLRHTSAPPGKE
jgi:hypothetical protein